MRINILKHFDFCEKKYVGIIPLSFPISRELERKQCQTYHIIPTDEYIEYLFRRKQKKKKKRNYNMIIV